MKRFARLKHNGEAVAIMTTDDKDFSNVIPKKGNEPAKIKVISLGFTEYITVVFRNEPHFSSNIGLKFNDLEDLQFI